LDFALSELERAVAAQADCSNGVRDGLRRLLEYSETEPDLARCCLAEMSALGAPGEECRVRALKRLAAALRPTDLNADTRRPDRMTLTDELVAGGVWHAIGAAITAEQATSVTSLLSALHSYTVLLYEPAANTGAEASPRSHPNAASD